MTQALAISYEFAALVLTGALWLTGIVQGFGRFSTFALAACTVFHGCLLVGLSLGGLT